MIQYLLAVLAAVLVLLLVLLLLTGGSMRNLVGFFVEELDEDNVPLHPVKLFPAKAAASPAPKKAPARPAPAPKAPARTAPAHKQQNARNGARRNPNQAYTEMAILTHKIDERRRVVDSSGHSTLFDEYFELVFETRRGETLRLVTSRAAFKETPFNQDGALTYKKGRLIRFKYAGGIVTDELPTNAR